MSTPEKPEDFSDLFADLDQIGKPPAKPAPAPAPAAPAAAPTPPISSVLPTLPAGPSPTRPPLTRGSFALPPAAAHPQPPAASASLPTSALGMVRPTTISSPGATARPIPVAPSATPPPATTPATPRLGRQSRPNFKPDLDEDTEMATSSSPSAAPSAPPAAPARPAPATIRRFTREKLEKLLVGLGVPALFLAAIAGVSLAGENCNVKNKKGDSATPAPAPAPRAPDESAAPSEPAPQCPMLSYFYVEVDEQGQWHRAGLGQGWGIKNGSWQAPQVPPAPGSGNWGDFTLICPTGETKYEFYMIDDLSNPIDQDKRRWDSPDFLAVK